MRGEWFEGEGAKGSRPFGASGLEEGSDRQQTQAESAIRNSDRAACCPPYGHLTSSW
jgi:hypothetical protein